MASNSGPSRPSETDIPARSNTTNKDQAAAAAAASLGAHKPYTHPSDPQGASADLSTAADAATASAVSTAAGEAPYSQHSSMQGGPQMPHPSAHPAYSHSGPPSASAAYPSYPNPYGLHTPGDTQAAEQAAAFMAAAAAANMRSAQGAAAGSYGEPGGQDPMQQQQQGPPQLGSPGLPEAAPALKTDPVELSLLTKYLQIVRQTQGEAAAAQAMAASGLPLGTSLEGDGPTAGPDYPAPHSHSAHTPSSTGPYATFSSAPSSATTVVAEAAGGAFNAVREHGSSGSNDGTPTATGGSNASLAAEPLAVQSLLGFIKTRKLAGIARQPASRRSSSGSTVSAHGAGGSVGGASAASGTAAQGRKIWIQPSGPRRPGEGVENEEQGILSAEEVPTTGEVMMRITLLAAGFVIGPSGSSVREIVRLSGADINSWTEATGSHRGRRPARIFLIKGEPSCVAQAVYVITAAVDRYKELCEGKYSGQSVPRSQNVLGVTFSFQPPPKSIVPCAASLKELYAPPNTVANSARYAVSPPNVYGLHPHPSRGAVAGARGLRGSPPHIPGYPYHPHLYEGWQQVAMMNAAAAMGMTPMQALAAAGGQHGAAAAAAAAAAGFGGLGGGLGAMGGPYGAAGMMGFAGFDGGLNPLGAGTPPAGGLDPMTVAAAGLNPYAAAMMGGADAFSAAGGSMFGMLPTAAGDDPTAAAADAAGGGVGGMEGLPGAGASLAGYPGWSPGMFDPTGMAALMAGAGLYNPVGAAVADPTAAAAADGLFPQNPMASAALAAAGLDPAALAAMDSSSSGLGLPANLGAASGVPSAAGSELSTPTAAAADSANRADEFSAGAAGGGPQAASRFAREASGGPSSYRGEGRYGPDLSRTNSHPRSNLTGPLWPGGLPPPSPFYRGPGLHLPHLIIPQEPTEGPHPQSPSSARGGRGPHGGPGGMPFPPASPGAPLLNFGPLFHPMSPAAPRMGPYMGGMPFGPVPPSPVRLMRDKSGQQIPYMEVGGTVYFAPASPMPPQGGSPHRSGSRPIPPPAPPAEPYPGFDEPNHEQGPAEQQDGQQQQQYDDTASPTAAAAAAAAGGSGSSSPVEPGTAGSNGSGRSFGRGGAADNGRPQSRSGDLRYFTDNPYLSQGAIGSGAAGYYQQPPGQQRHQQQQQQQWQSQARRNAGSSNSVAGPTGMQDGRQQGGPSEMGDGGAGSGNGANRPSVPPPRPPSAEPPASAYKSTPQTQQQQQQQGAAPADDAAYNDYDQSPAATTAAAGQPASAFASGGRSPSMNELAAATAAAAAGSAAAGGGSKAAAPTIGSSVSNVATGVGGWLDAHDPIVSPGRITLASKVKAARLYNTSGRKGGQTPSPTGGMGSS